MLLFKCVLILLFVYYFLWSLFLNFSFTSFLQVIWPFLQNCILVSSMFKRIFLNSFHNKYSSFSGYLICVHIWTHLWLVYSSLLIPVHYHLQGSMETLFSFSSFAPLAFKYSFKVLCGIVIFFLQSVNMIYKGHEEMFSLFCVLFFEFYCHSSLPTNFFYHFLTV